MDATPTLTIPLRTDDDGTIRIGNTRVILDLVIHAFREGATPETIVERYSALDLSDVYLVLGYYLQRRDEVDAYIRQREAEAETIREKLEQEFPSTGIRERLLARQKSNRES